MSGTSRKRSKKQKNVTLPHKLNEKQKESVKKYLDGIYNDPKSGGGFSTPFKLLKEVRRRGHYTNLGIRRIQNYLNNQMSYTLYKPSVRRFPTPPVVCTRIKQQMDMDLVDVSRQQSFNDGVKYLVSAIDCLSKVGYLKPIKSKDGKEVAKAVSQILDEIAHIDRVCTDRGSEWKSHHFQQLMRDRGIHHFFAGGSGSASIVER